MSIKIEYERVREIKDVSISNNKLWGCRSLSKLETKEQKTLQQEERRPIFQIKKANNP